MRLMIFFGFCVTLLTLTGCVGAFDPFQRPGNWAETGAANETIAQQAANPSDLISGRSDPLSNGIAASAAIDKALGHPGKANGEVYQFTIPRAETLMDGGMAIPVSMGTGIAINFQPTGNSKAAITGDFVLIAKEVNPVIKALRENGIEVTAVHNHMLDDQPRLFFMHFWANDDAQKLAKGLRAALDKVNVAKS